jgi:hypothetical protein
MFGCSQNSHSIPLKQSIRVEKLGRYLVSSSMLEVGPEESTLRNEKA